MKAIRFLLAFVAAFCLLPFSAFAVEKTLDSYYLDDVYYDHWAYKELEDFVYADIIDGYVEYDEEEDYSWVSIRPESTVTRAQFTKILVNAMDLQLGTDVTTFADVKSTDWYSSYVSIASSHGIITGREGKFYPYEKITRQQMAAMIYRAFKPTISFNKPTKLFKDVPTSSYAYEAIHLAAANGIINGYGDSFKPSNLATRAQAVVMIYRALHQESATDEEGAAVVNALDSYIQNEARNINLQDMNALATHYNQSTSGYYLADMKASMQMFKMIDEVDGNYSVKIHDNYIINISAINQRYAKVQVKNLKYDISIEIPDTTMTSTEDASGIYYLKRDAKGSWKIYNAVFYEDVRENLEYEVASAIK